VNPFELRQLKMQEVSTKSDSIRARLGGENEFDGVSPAALASNAAVRAGWLLDGENGATMNRHGADELTAAVAYASGWVRLEFAQVCTEAMGTGEDKSG
jgi:hypothetical protein